MKEIYEKKGYPQDWIDKRLRGIAIRQNLTDEWKERGIEDQKDFAILTAWISKKEKPKKNLAEALFRNIICCIKQFISDLLTSTCYTCIIRVTC